MNKEHIINEAYENYSKEYEKDNSIGMCLLVKRLDGKSTYRKPNKEMFVDLCTYDKTFSEKWGLKIEERELKKNSGWERYELLLKRISEKELQEKYKDDERATWLGFKKFTLVNANYICDKENIPTKLITITYNDKTIEIYE
jgi:hypothetical protein